MHLFTIINTLADLAMLWLLMCSSKSEDRAHPLAAYVTITAAPYCARLYPMIMRSTTFAVNPIYDPHYHTNMQAYELMYLRDRSFESIMLATTFFVILIGGACCVEGVLRSIRQDQPLSACQVRRRVIIPLCFGLFLTMAIYNNVITIQPSNKLLDPTPNIPLFFVFLVASACWSIAMIVGSLKLRNLTGEISEHRQHMIRCFTSFQTFFMISAVPIFFIIYQMIPQYGYIKFWFSDMENFVRLIFLAAIMCLEPYATRLRVRQTFYRTGISGNSGSVEETKEKTVPPTVSPQAPIQPSPPSAPAPPPAYEVAAQQMHRPTWSPHTISELDVNFKKTPLTPIESA